MNPDQKVLDKVRKLFALAEDNNNESEGRNALLTAQRLMAEHGLKVADLESAAEANIIGEGIAEDKIRRTPWWVLGIAEIIAMNFRCKVLRYTYRGKPGGKRNGGYRLVFFGRPQDTELATEAYKFALRYCQRSLRAWQLTHPRALTRPYRNAYLEGFIYGLKEAFEKQVTTMALVVIPDKEVEQAFKDKTKGRNISNQPYGVNQNDQISKMQGYYDGQNAINRRGELGEG
ncbi:MAG: DUF2786 domain-containing protein [Patescibacteria group bacterium]|nr:DUF2786 domain-containing protein [Patescibacteria group bacterium]